MLPSIAAFENELGALAPIALKPYDLFLCPFIAKSVRDYTLRCLGVIFGLLAVWGSLELAFCKTRSRIIGGCLGYLSYALHGITVVWIVAGITELTLVYG